MATARSFDSSIEETAPTANAPAREAKATQQAVPVAEEIRCLRPDEMALWDSFVDCSPQGSLFSRSWWLRAVGGDTRVLGCFRKGQLVAGIPLHFEKYYGIPFCRMPKITPLWGVLLSPPNGKRASVASEENGILKAMAAALRQYRFFFQFFSTEFDNWLPFFWAGYSQTTRYTYRIAVDDLDRVWQEMAPNVRNQIRAAQKAGITVVPCGPEQVYALEEETYRRQGMKMPHSWEYLSGLYKAAQEQDAGACAAAVDAKGNVYCAGFCVWDSQTTSALVLGNNSELRTSGATSLLNWHFIQESSRRSKTFDFCGSFVENIERFVRSFGGRRIPYYRITRFPRLVKAGLSFAGKI